MAGGAITIHVNSETAQRYEAASEEEKRQLDVLLTLKLTEAVQDEKSLEAIMRELSQKAETRGLTPEKLKMLL